MHFVHLGHVGLVMNLRWGEVADFLVGWTTLDLAGDDGKRFAHWPWMPARPEPARQAGARP
jgi:hypothetical protein